MRALLLIVAIASVLQASDLYLAVANDVMKIGLDSFPTASRKLEGLV